MAYRLERERTDTTPYVLIDEEQGIMRLEGESYHENIFVFFQEINAWLGKYLQTDFDSLTFDCKLKYFNSSTVKLLLNILLEMDRSPHSKNITVNWITTKNNIIITECGEDFQEDVKNMTFNLITDKQL